MATDWSMEGVEVANCNCDWGCPCQFNQQPSHGDCRAYAVIQIDKGHFGAISLDGLRWAIFAEWPGPIHLGKGTFQAVVDQRADAAQRRAIEAVAHGLESEPGALVWQVFAATVERVLPTIAAHIDMTVDIDRREAIVRIEGRLDGQIHPITNPATGQPRRVRVTVPDGLEYADAEFASGTSTASGPIPIQFNATHAHLARIHWTRHGVVR